MFNNTEGRTNMDNESMEQRVWNWLEGVPGWGLIGAPHLKEEMPSVGMIPAALALAIGDQKIYFATGEVKELDPINGFERFSVEVSIVAENGLFWMEATVGRGNAFDGPAVSWRPLSAIKSMRITTNKSWWEKDYPYFQLSVELRTEASGTFSLRPGTNQTATRDALVETVRLLQRVGVARS